MIVPSLRVTSVSLLTLAVAIFASFPRTASSYEIAPRKKVHETLTLMANDCLRRGPHEVRPSICLPAPAPIMDDKGLKDAALDFKSRELGLITAKQLMEAVKWPDDPTKEVGAWTIFKFGIKLLGQCEERYLDGLEDGLLCSSHYGPLQFWHSMASSDDEPTVETQRKMRDWAEFLYKVAAGQVNPGEDYCGYWREQENLGKGELANILAPKDKFPCTKSGPRWTIGTLFSMSCTRMFSSTKCTEWLDPRVARVNALGALLHMVQDSYAQGHAGRGDAELIPGTKRVKAKFECLPITQFYTYGKQDTKKHRQADAHPETGRSCANAPTIDDPILASATVLWFVQKGGDGAELSEYLRNRVFRLAEPRQAKAGPGHYFEK